ncbi:MAG: alpha/beta fold hydrolase [Halioglobus sp.]
MVRKRSRKFWAITLLSVITGVGLLWFASVYFLSTAEAIRHAEAFLFRRMSVAQLSQQGEYRFFFITNRQTRNAAGDVGDRYSNERHRNLDFGRFDTEIMPSLGLGMLIDPTSWLQDEEIELKRVETRSREDFVSELSDQASASKHGAVYILLHGYREAHESALRKTAFVGHVLDVDAPIVVFDWPGDQGGSPRGYRRAHRIASESAAELADTIEMIVNEVRPKKIWLLANSMGGQVVVDAFGRLYENADFADNDTEIDHVVLTAPDVDHEQFNALFKKQLAALAQQLTVYVSSNDRALLVSRIINRGTRLGESTLSPDQFSEAVRLSELTGKGDRLVNLVDVTPVNRTRNFHNFSLETPEFFDDLFLRLTNSNMPNSRPIYHIETPEGAVYSVLTRAR